MRPIDLALYAFFTGAGVLALWSLWDSFKKLLEFLDDISTKP